MPFVNLPEAILYPDSAVADVVVVDSEVTRFEVGVWTAVERSNPSSSPPPMGPEEMQPSKAPSGFWVYPVNYPRLKIRQSKKLFDFTTQRSSNEPWLIFNNHLSQD